MYTQYIAFVTILRREVQRFIRIWPQTLLPPAIGTTLYFVIFGQLIGKQIGEMNGFSYMSFIVPGLIMMSIINNSFGNVAHSFFSSKFQHNIEELLISPASEHCIILGYVFGGILRGLCVAFIVTMVSLFFVNMNIFNIFITLFVVFLTAAVFSLAGLINAIFAKSFDDVSIVPTFVLTPLTYLGGVFYSMELLPEFWRTISLINPVLHMVNSFRYGMLGISDVNIYVAINALIIFALVAYFYAFFLLKKGLGIRT